MRKKPLLAFAAFGATAAITTTVLWPSPDPSFHGKSLEKWVHLYLWEFMDNPESPQTREAADAIVSIGDRAIPSLTHWIQHEEKPWRERFKTAINNFPLSSSICSALDRSEARAREAEHAFDALGTNASNAVPILSKLLEDTNNLDTAIRASTALCYIGKPAVPALLQTLRKPGLANRDLAAHALACIKNPGEEAALAVPILLRLLDEPDTELVDCAALALGSLGLQADQVVPALAKKLNNSEPSALRMRAAYSLSDFKGSASPAIPQLLSARNDPDPVVRSASAYALTQIDPATYWTNSPSP